MKNLIGKLTKISNYLTVFRVSLFKLGNWENGYFDLIKNPIGWHPSYLLKRNKKKDKGLNSKMISLSVSKIQGFYLHQQHHTDANFLGHIFFKKLFTLI